jgi:DNA-binding response OmpR family regulator
MVRITSRRSVGWLREHCEATGGPGVLRRRTAVEVTGSRVHLTAKEYQMLGSLRTGTTLTKEMFLNHLYGGMDEPELKIIDVSICKLRKKLGNASQGRKLKRCGAAAMRCASRSTTRSGFTA